MEIISNKIEKSVIENHKIVWLTKNIGIENILTETFQNGELILSEESSKMIGDIKRKHGVVRLFDKKVREIHRKHNVFQSNDKEVKNVYNLYLDNPYSVIEKYGDNWSDYAELLEDNWNNHTIGELDGTPISKRFYFDYMSGIRNGNYNLKKLIKHLRQFDSIEILSEIEFVPYYNNSPECNTHFAFFVRPTDDEWKMILKIDKQREVYVEDNFKSKIANFYQFNKFLSEEKFDEFDN